MPAAGRPRRFEPADELRILFDAAFAVLQRNGYEDMTVADILREAGLSTRSFYRHFESKDELLAAMYRREAERAADRVQAAVSGASSPRLALEAWVDEILSIGHDRKKAARAAVMASAVTARGERHSVEARNALRLLTAPLKAILAEGAADGSFPVVHPARDASLIQAVAWAAAGLEPSRGPRWNRSDAREAVLSFCFRALGATRPD